MRLLVTFDGSALSEHALAVMVPWVKRWGAEVVLLGVLDPAGVQATVDLAGRQPVGAMRLDSARALTPIPAPPFIVEDRNQAFVAARNMAEDEMRELARRHLPGVPVSVRAEFGEDVAQTIAQFARENMADFLAMSSHGRSGMSQALMGSVASAVVREAQLPVIVIGENTILPAGG